MNLTIQKASRPHKSIGTIFKTGKSDGTSVASLEGGGSHVFSGFQRSGFQMTTDELKKLVAAATPGRRVQFHGYYYKEADGTDIFEAALGVEKHFAAIRQETSDD